MQLEGGRIFWRERKRTKEEEIEREIRRGGKKKERRRARNREGKRSSKRNHKGGRGARESKGEHGHALVSQVEQTVVRHWP